MLSTSDFSLHAPTSGAAGQPDNSSDLYRLDAQKRAISKAVVGVVGLVATATFGSQAMAGHDRMLSLLCIGLAATAFAVTVVILVASCCLETYGQSHVRVHVDETYTRRHERLDAVPLRVDYPRGQSVSLPNTDSATADSAGSDVP